MSRACTSLSLCVLCLVVACSNEATPRAGAAALTGGDPGRGRAAVGAYGCGGCHLISQLPGAVGKVGPPLDGLGHRLSVAGVLPNTTAELLRWIRHPQQVKPGVLMPELGIGEQDARDIAAFLYSLP